MQFSFDLSRADLVEKRMVFLVLSQLEGTSGDFLLMHNMHSTYRGVAVSGPGQWKALPIRGGGLEVPAFRCVQKIGGW